MPPPRSPKGSEKHIEKHVEKGTKTEKQNRPTVEKRRSDVDVRLSLKNFEAVKTLNS